MWDACKLLWSLFVVPTISFRLLYGLLILRHERRRLLWLETTTHPTAEWIARQLTEACGWDEALCYLIRGRRNQERPGANLVPSRASDASRYPIRLMAYASGARARLSR